MTNARKAHVYRIYQTDDRGNITNASVWLDVMRVDKLEFNEQRGTPTGATHQGRIYGVAWGDDTWDGGKHQGGPNGASSRIVEPLAITEPPYREGQDPADPSLASINIPLIQRTQFIFRGGVTGHQIVEWAFQNFPDQVPNQIASMTGRQGQLLRITNNDLNGEIAFPDVNAGDAPPPTRQGAQIDWLDYAKALKDGTVDDTQYVDISTVDRFKIRFPPSPFDDPKALLGQIVTYVMLNKQQGNGPLGVEDLFKPPPQGERSSAVYLTDPFQVIVNVSWSGLAVDFGDGAADGTPA